MERDFFMWLCLMAAMVINLIISFIGMDTEKKVYAKLSGVKWVLQTLNDKELSLTDPNSEIFIQFNEAEHRVNGRGGCNRFFGNYEMESSRLKFSPMGATRMACPDLQTETEFFQMLDGVDGYSIKDNKLSFLSKNKVVAVFKKAEEAK